MLASTSRLFFRTIRMRAAVLHEFGPAENLRIEDTVTKPAELKDSEVLVKIACSGVNPVDTYLRAGLYPVLPKLPFVTGRDGAGVVEAVGVAVTNVRVGDRVWVNSGKNGTAGEYCIVDKVCALPDDVTFEQGACLGVPYLTAYTALFRQGGVNAKGEGAKKKLLVHGASGAVGLAAIQLAAAHPQSFSVVVGTAGSETGQKFVQENGASHCVNHREDGYLAELKKFDGFDVILEMNAHLNLNKSIELLAKEGRVVVIGSRGQIDFDPRSLMKKDAAVIGCGLANSLDKTFPHYSAAITHFLKTTDFRPRVAKVFELSDISQAHQLVTAGGPANGKIVVRVANT
ncbi:unnamed protein product, partial [Mesorhabditis spiculigera]